MTDKELRKLDRRELLEMLLMQTEEVERLKEELKLAKAEAESREIRLQECGSIAEAAISLNGVYEAAEAAAQQYLENIRRCSEQQQEKMNRILGEAEKKAEAILLAAEEQRAKRMQEADDYWKLLSSKLESFYEEHRGLRELLTQGGIAK